MKATRTCSVEDCDRPSKSRGYCKTHYSRLLRTGEVGSYPIQRGRVCSIDGCGAKHYGKGYCAKHHARLVRHGDPLIEPKRRPAECKVDGCGREVEARELCKMHYTRWWEGREVGGAAPLNRYDPICSVDGCDKPHRSYGYCLMHYERWRKYQDADYRKIEHGGTGIGYGAAHDRVRRRHGSASWYPCEHCGERAEDWAYDHSDPDARVVRHLGAWYLISLDPDHYISLCKPCHKKLDLNRI